MPLTVNRGTSDPAQYKSRVFVGNAPTFGTTKEEYQELFEPFGNVLAVSVHKGFVFVQFEREEEAQEACRQKEGTMFKDHKLVVSMSKGDRKNKDRQQGAGDNRLNPPASDDRRRNDRDRNRSRDRGMGYGEDRRRNSRDRSPVRSRNDVDRMGRDNSLRDALSRRSFRATGKSRFDEPAANRRYDHQDDRGNTNVDNYRETAMELSPGPQPLSTDCEIVIPHHQQRVYGELVESRLKNLGITCDILFPHDPSQLAQVLDDIARRGCRYAVVLLPQNEQHKSATVHILWGVTPEEHRNMPLDKAMNLIACNYENYLTSVREKEAAKTDADSLVPPMMQPMVQQVSQPVTPAIGRADPTLSIDNRPDADDGVHEVFKLLAEGRPISVPQIDAVVRHLLQRRMQILNDEPSATTAVSTAAAGPGFNLATGEPHAVATTVEKDIADQQAEIQKRILDILTALAAPTLNLPAASSNVSNLSQVAHAGGSGTWSNSSAAVSQLNPSAQMMGYDDSSMSKQLDTLSQKAMLLRNLQTTAMPTHGSTAVASQQMLAMAQQQPNSQASGLGMVDMKNSRPMQQRMGSNSHGYLGNMMMGQSRY